jgi:YjbE family integral membrane protein
MEFQTYVSWIASPVQIAFLDLVLGADNAVIIALVCRTLPRHQRLNVMIVGTGAALLLRIVLTALAGALMFVPLLRLAGGLVLVLIAVSLTDELDVGPIAHSSDTGGDGKPRDKVAESEAFWDAILLVVLADGVMSLDNTVALAAVAQGNVVYLVLGLVLSVPTLVFGSWILSDLLGQTPFLARAAMAVLGWVAGDMAVSDPLVADWIANTAPALTLGVPIASVVFVLAKSAFKPIVVPLPMAGPLDGSGGARVAEGGDDAAVQLAEPVTTAAPIAVIAVEPPPLLQAAAPAAIGKPDPIGEARAAMADDRESEPAAGPVEPAPRRAEERFVIIGILILFGVAAAIISSAIYFGGATF